VLSIKLPSSPLSGLETSFSVSDKKSECDTFLNCVGRKTGTIKGDELLSAVPVIVKAL